MGLPCGGLSLLIDAGGPSQQWEAPFPRQAVMGYMYMKPEPVSDPAIKQYLPWFLPYPSSCEGSLLGRAEDVYNRKRSCLLVSAFAFLL